MLDSPLLFFALLMSTTYVFIAVYALQEAEEGAGGLDAERPPEAGGGSSSMPSAAPADVMDTVQ